MTRYSTLNVANKDKESGKTIFREVLSADKTVRKTYIKPGDMEVVVFLGHDMDYGDMFLAQRLTCRHNYFAIFFGIRGDEFEGL